MLASVCDTVERGITHTPVHPPAVRAEVVQLRTHAEIPVVSVGTEAAAELDTL